VSVHGDTCSCLTCDLGRSAQARVDERAAIVAWLRTVNLARGMGMGMPGVPQRREAAALFADAIAAGEHEEPRRG
jgi:hypothetical protein